MRPDFRDFSDWPEHLKPIVLNGVPEDSTDCIDQILHSEGSGVPTAVVQNTMKAYGFTRESTALKPMTYLQAMVTREKLKELGVDDLTYTQVRILAGSLFTKIGNKKRDDIAEEIFSGEDYLSLDDVFERAGVPFRRPLKQGFETYHLEKLRENIYSAPDELGPGEIRRYLVQTRSEVRMAFKPLSDHYSTNLPWVPRSI